MKLNKKYEVAATIWIFINVLFIHMFLYKKIFRSHTNDPNIGSVLSVFQPSINLIEKSDSNSFDVPDDVQINCSNEWHKITDRAYAKKSTGYFFMDKRQLGFYILRDRRFPTSFRMKAEIALHGEPIFSTQINKLVERVEFDFVINYIISFVHTDILEINLKMLREAKLQVFLGSNVTDDYNPIPFEIKIKNFRNDHSKNKQKNSIVCSQMVFFGASHADRFNWWFEILRLSGYNKVSNQGLVATARNFILILFSLSTC